VLSYRLIQQQFALQFDFGDDVDELSTVVEPQRGQSDSAGMKQPSLDQSRSDLMQKIVGEAIKACYSRECHVKSTTNDC